MEKGQDRKPQVAVVMGSANDWPVMRKATEKLDLLGIRHEARVISAHRTPDDCNEYSAGLAERGFFCVIAGAGGAAHLPGVIAAKTTLPVLGVPIAATPLAGFDALLAIVQMPAGVPVATFAVGEPGAANAGLFAGAMLAQHHADVRAKLASFRNSMAAKVRSAKLD